MNWICKTKVLKTPDEARIASNDEPSCSICEKYGAIEYVDNNNKYHACCLDHKILIEKQKNLGNKKIFTKKKVSKNKNKKVVNPHTLGTTSGNKMKDELLNLEILVTEPEKKKKMKRRKKKTKKEPEITRRSSWTKESVSPRELKLRLEALGLNGHSDKNEKSEKEFPKVSRRKLSVDLVSHLKSTASTLKSSKLQELGINYNKKILKKKRYSKKSPSSSPRDNKSSPKDPKNSPSSSPRGSNSPRDSNSPRGTKKKSSPRGVKKKNSPPSSPKESNSPRDLNSPKDPKNSPPSSPRGSNSPRDSNSPRGTKKKSSPRGVKKKNSPQTSPRDSKNSSKESPPSSPRESNSPRKSKIKRKSKKLVAPTKKTPKKVSRRSQKIKKEEIVSDSETKKQIKNLTKSLSPGDIKKMRSSAFIPFTNFSSGIKPPTYKKFSIPDYGDFTSDPILNLKEKYLSRGDTSEKWMGSKKQKNLREAFPEGKLFLEKLKTQSLREKKERSRLSVQLVNFEQSKSIKIENKIEREKPQKHIAGSPNRSPERLKKNPQLKNFLPKLKSFRIEEDNEELIQTPHVVAPTEKESGNIEISIKETSPNEEIINQISPNEENNSNQNEKSNNHNQTPPNEEKITHNQTPPNESNNLDSPNKESLPNEESNSPSKDVSLNGESNNLDSLRNQSDLDSSNKEFNQNHDSTTKESELESDQDSILKENLPFKKPLINKKVERLTLKRQDTSDLLDDLLEVTQTPPTLRHHVNRYSVSNDNQFPPDPNVNLEDMKEIERNKKKTKKKSSRFSKHKFTFKMDDIEEEN